MPPKNKKTRKRNTIKGASSSSAENQQGRTQSSEDVVDMTYMERAILAVERKGLANTIPKAGGSDFPSWRTFREMYVEMKSEIDLTGYNKEYTTLATQYTVSIEKWVRQLENIHGGEPAEKSGVVSNF